MLAKVIQELTPQLVRRVAAKASSVSPPAPCPTGQVAALLRQLAAALDAGQVDFASCGHLSIGVDVEAFLGGLRLLKECVYEALDERAATIPARELRLVADWFGALTERVLREQNRRFVAMLDALPDHLLLQDPSGSFLFTNRAAAAAATAISGRATGRLVGRNLLDLGLPTSFTDYLMRLSARVTGGESVQDEFVIPMPDGATWREHHLAPVFAADGSVEAIAVASRDIHARKVAEARLQLLSKVGMLAETTEYEGVLTGVARLSLPELADWCIIDVVDEGRVRRGTVAHRDPEKTALAEELLRFSPESYDLPLGRELLSGGLFLVGELDEAGMRERAPEFYEVVRRLGARSVMVVPFVVLGAPIAVATFVFGPESGRKHGAADLALAQEMARRAAQIVENARLHERLRQSEARFRVALERSNIAVFEEDTEFRVRWSYNSHLGAPASERAVAGYLPPIADEVAAIKRRVLASGEGARAEVTGLVDGQRRHFLVNYEPLRGVAGIAGITGAAVDITEAKRVQDELGRALAFRDRVIGILGHDLRNPLSAVTGLSALLQLHAGASAELRAGLERIEMAGKRMNEIIGTILEFTRMRFSGPPPLAPAPVQLDALARAVVDELRVAHPGRAIDIATDGDLEGRWDAGRIGQVVSNLVGNALTHGAEGAPVQLALSQEEGGVRLVVTNRGPTIPAAFIGQLFEPFWQAPAAGESPRRGLGLGLFIVRQLVAAHGGTVEVRSADEVTAFTVRLPRSVAA